MRGRHAWIQAQRNRLVEAVRLMRLVLAENQSYLWGWSQLTAWLIKQELTDEAMSALEQMQRLRPHDAWINRQFGFLRLRQKDPAGAQKAFATALEAAPTDIAAAHNLLDLQLDADDFDGATATLQVMQMHQPGGATRVAETRLCLRRRQNLEAIRAFELLCASPDPDPWPMDAATEAFRNAGCLRLVPPALKRALRSDHCNPQAGAILVRILLAKRATLRAWWSFSRLPAGEIQRRAAAPLIHGLAQMYERFPIRWLLWRRRSVFHLDGAAWGQVGFTLSHFNLHRQVVNWMSDG